MSVVLMSAVACLRACSTASATVVLAASRSIKAAEVSLQRLAGLSRANLHRAYGVSGHVPAGERGHECVLSSLTA
jgi:hypothetical protein